jgi:hypothetical protein
LEDRERELLSFIEGDAAWWDRAAQDCEDLAKKLGGEDEARLILLCAVYRERAQAHRELVKSMRLRQISGNQAE